MSAIDGVTDYPVEVAQRYRDLGLWTGQTHDDLLRSAVEARPEHVAVVAPDGRLTYAELDRRVCLLASGLGKRGVEPTDRVVLQLPNTAEFVVAAFALWRLGAVPVFALPAHGASDVAYFCEHAGAVGVIRTPEGGGSATFEPLPRVEDPPNLGQRGESTAPGSGSDVAFLQMSGGTTGRPKLIPRTHDDYLYSVRESATICGLDADTVLLVALPVAHNFAMSSPGILGAIAVHGTIVLAPDATPETVFGLIEAERATIVPAVPALALAWLNSPLAAWTDLSSLQVLQVGGARLADTVAARVRAELGCTLQQVFGMAEGLVNYTRLDDPAEIIETTQGRPISPHDEVRVVDDADVDVPDGTPGHLLTRGPYTIRGYYRAPEHNARSFTADGFYRTGDIVVRRPDGNLVVAGRAKEQINRAGEKVAPIEVEEHLLRHAPVHDVVVTGVADDIVGERIRAHLVLRAGADRVRPADLRRHLRASGLAAFKIPDEFVVTEALPATGVGKIDRRTLTGQDAR